MVKPAAYRQAVGFLQSEFEFSERRACNVVGHARSSNRYVPRRTMVQGLLDELRQQASSDLASGTGDCTSFCDAADGA
jgi:hypothetical protein